MMKCRAGLLYYLTALKSPMANQVINGAWVDPNLVGCHCAGRWCIAMTVQVDISEPSPPALCQSVKVTQITDMDLEMISASSHHPQVDMTQLPQHTVHVHRGLTAESCESHRNIEEENRKFFNSPMNDHLFNVDTRERGRLVAASMLEVYPFDKQKTVVMDFACGTGQPLLKFIGRRGILNLRHDESRSYIHTFGGSCSVHFGRGHQSAYGRPLQQWCQGEHEGHLYTRFEGESR